MKKKIIAFIQENIVDYRLYSPNFMLSLIILNRTYYNVVQVNILKSYMHLQLIYILYIYIKIIYSLPLIFTTNDFYFLMNSLHKLFWYVFMTKEIFIAAFFSMFQETCLLSISRLCEICCKAYLSATGHSEHCLPFSAHEKKVQRLRRVKVTFEILLWPLIFLKIKQTSVCCCCCCCC